MKKEIIEYHPNGEIKHKIVYQNGQKWFERFYDSNGRLYRLNKPCKIDWFSNGSPQLVAYGKYDKLYNVNNPAKIIYYQNRKIRMKGYGISNTSCFRARIIWVNKIKNI